MLKRVLASTALLACLCEQVVAASAERYELLFTEANYTSADQHELKYASFVGDRETGSLYSCSGTILLDQKTGALKTHNGSCVTSLQSGSAHGDYSFARISALDATAKTDAPKMNPAWGFWRIDQVKASHDFCMRFGAPNVVWKCFESSLPK